jgi:hypothetical protein
MVDESAYSPPTSSAHDEGPMTRSTTARFLPWGDEMDVAAILAALGGERSADPVVLLRLFLMAVDDATGDQRLVGSFVRRLAMPVALVGAGMRIALELRGERHVFTPSSVTWDDMHRACIIEVVWTVAADDDGIADSLTAEASRVV